MANEYNLQTVIENLKFINSFNGGGYEKNLEAALDRSRGYATDLALALNETKAKLEEVQQELEKLKYPQASQ